MKEIELEPGIENSMIDPDFENSNKDSIYQIHGSIKETEAEMFEVLPENNDSKDIEVTEKDQFFETLEYESDDTSKAELSENSFDRRYLQFKSKDALVTQEKPHDIARFSCELCTITYKKKDNLKRHIKLKHSSMSELLMDKLTMKKPAAKKGTFIGCETCGKYFKKTELFKKHMLIHTREKNFKCKVCEKGFIFKGDLKNHERVHTGEKPFQCKLCLKRFAQSSSLKCHERTLSCETKTFRCKICKDTFSGLSQLKSHGRNRHLGEDYW